jgi:transcriptional regulator with XRE-family HTH domain
LETTLSAMKAADELRQDFLRASKGKAYKTQQEFASALGISAQYLTDIIKQRRRFTPAMLHKAAEVLGVNPIRAQRWQRLGAVESGWKIDERIQA